MTKGFGSEPDSLGETAPTGASRIAAEAAHVTGPDNTDGTTQEAHQVSEIPVVAANVRWERLTRRSFWDSLAAPERLALAASGVEEMFRVGSVLCREGDESSHVMIVESGWAKVSVTVGADAGEQIIAVRGPGDVIGERAALLARRVRPA